RLFGVVARHHGLPQHRARAPRQRRLHIEEHQVRLRAELAAVSDEIIHRLAGVFGTVGSNKNFHARSVVILNPAKDVEFGAGRETRTLTVLPPADFESAASTDSAIPAFCPIINDASHAAPGTVIVVNTSRNVPQSAPKDRLATEKAGALTLDDFDYTLPP